MSFSFDGFDMPINKPDIQPDNNKIEQARGVQPLGLSEDEAFILEKDFFKDLETNVFPKIQELLKKPGWKGHRTYDAEHKVYFLTDAQWSDTKGVPQALRKEVQDAFYSAMESVVVELSKKSGINKDIYILMAGKESNFGTSYLAQVANNPFSINDQGKEPALSKEKYPNTIKWKDDGNEYDFYVFKNLADACSAFEKLHAFWAKRFPEYKKLKVFTKDQSLIILVKYWGSGKHGEMKEYKEWLERVENRRY